MLSTWFLRQMTPDSTMPWWQVNSSELDAQKKNRDHSGLGGTARSKCHCQHFCQGACAYVGLIREMVSATGLHASTEGTWLTQLPHDSGFRPPPMAARGVVWLFLGAGLFSSLLRNGAGQMVLSVACSLWRGLPLLDWRLSPGAGASGLSNKDFPFSSLVWLRHCCL